MVKNHRGKNDKVFDMITGLVDQLKIQEKKIQVLERKNQKLVTEDELGLIFEKFDSRMIIQEQLIAKSQVFKILILLLIEKPICEFCIVKTAENFSY